MRVSRIGLLAAAAALVGGGIAVPAFASDQRFVAPNNDPAFVQVVDNNLENLPTAGLKCPGDWQDLVQYLKRAPLKPDIMTIQQISDQAQLNAYVDKLSNALGEKYAGLIAEAKPSNVLHGRCGEPKLYQTNAVIYRTARFADRGLGHPVWQAQATKNGKCANNGQARTKAVKVRLFDKIANQDVTVASVHWATAQSGGGAACSAANAKEITREMTADGYGGGLLIVGGDFNVSDVDGGFRGWYQNMNGDLGGAHNYRDPAFAACNGDRNCLRDNWTAGGDKRIDFLFANRPAGGLPTTSAFHTVTFDEGDAADQAETGSDRGDRDYSDHRAVMTRVHY